MADIFISYASKDRPTTRRLAEALEACGWSVWWDYRGLRGGQAFDRVIEKEISSARVVIVVWSQNSINSDWVRAEAANGLDDNKLAPVRIDGTVLPLRFRNIHTLDLSSWSGEMEAEPFERLLETLSGYLGPPRKTEQPARRTEPRSRAEPTDAAAGPPSLASRKHLGKYLAAIVATAGVLLGVVMLWERQEIFLPEPPTEATISKPPALTGDADATIGAALVRGDYKTALSLARPAAEQGDAAAQNRLGGMYMEGYGVAQDDAQAVQWFRKAAEQGDARAQYNLGMMYHLGRGVAQDDAQAVQWLRKAAEQGDANAQFNLGGMYMEGYGVPQDDTQAVQWFRKAAERGNADAQVFLGMMYREGRGVAQDDDQAVQWLRKAAEQGNAVAQNNLGMMYREGRGVAQDDAQAVQWLRKAAEQGNANAQLFLGVMYIEGRGVPQDKAQAKQWLRKAADQGHPDAQTILGLPSAKDKR